MLGSRDQLLLVVAATTLAGAFALDRVHHHGSLSRDGFKAANEASSLGARGTLRDDSFYHAVLALAYVKALVFVGWVGVKAWRQWRG